MLAYILRWFTMIQENCIRPYSSMSVTSSYAQIARDFDRFRVVVERAISLITFPRHLAATCDLRTYAHHFFKKSSILIGLTSGSRSFRFAS